MSQSAPNDYLAWPYIGSFSNIKRVELSKCRTNPKSKLLTFYLRRKYVFHYTIYHCFFLFLPLEIIILFMSLIEHIPNLDDASNLIMINKKQIIYITKQGEEKLTNQINKLGEKTFSLYWNEIMIQNLEKYLVMRKKVKCYFYSPWKVCNIKIL